MANNGDTLKEFSVGQDTVLGLGSFHKTLPHNEYGEVDISEFKKLVDACSGDGSGFASVLKGTDNGANFANPQAGLAADQLTHHPNAYAMPPAPSVLSLTTAAEMTELYWMACLRDVPFNQFETNPLVNEAATEINEKFSVAFSDTEDAGRLQPGIDTPGTSKHPSPIAVQNVFRLGLFGEEDGPMLSQFFVRSVGFGTQTIDSKQRPYTADSNYLTDFRSWLDAQRNGRDKDGKDYSRANETKEEYFEPEQRYISTMRDLARFVNKDALHQAYFNATLILLSGGAEWTPGNPYSPSGRLHTREVGFGVLGGPHILALVSEVATRALKVVWNQKWQVHLRLRPEAYGGLVHVQTLGVNETKRPYGLPEWVTKTKAATEIYDRYKSYLLPMAFTTGSPAHPAYGAGHATVAGACVTILKAYFKTFETINGEDKPVYFNTLKERNAPFGDRQQIKSYITGVNGKSWDRFELDNSAASMLTIEGELNKLAQNVAMGRSMGGVHWRTDNARSLILGEALAAEILAGITLDVNEHPYFEFRTFSRRSEDGKPKKVRIEGGKIYVDGVLAEIPVSAL